VREERLSIIDDIEIEIPKTKLLAQKFQALGFDTRLSAQSVLVITSTVSESLFLASRNLPHVAIVEPRYADPLSLLHFKKILVTKSAVAEIESMLL
jgi:large subunit ribosomal protein L4